jgi:hypothetical protein
LSNTVLISENDTDLRGEETLLGQLADEVRSINCRGLEPRGGSSLVG